MALHAGLTVAALGTLAPWAVVAGRTRHGYSTVELYLTLAGDGLPQGLRGLAWLWYSSVLASVGAWALLTLGRGPLVRASGAAVGLAAAAGFIAFSVWSARSVGVLLRPVGPVMSLSGIAAIVASAPPFRDPSRGAPDE